MTTPALNRISFGAARAVTRDGRDGPWLEMLVYPSRTQIG
jgi:hypothetical protein